MIHINKIFLVSILLLITSCSTDNGVAPEPINSLESQIVGKTFWRVIEGSANDPYNYIPHYYGIEFNEDGNIYARYCEDTLLVTEKSTVLNLNGIAYDGSLLSSYVIQDSIIKVEFSDWRFNEKEPYDEEYWSTKVIDYNANISFDEYQGMLVYLDYINVDPNIFSMEDLALSIVVKDIKDNFISLVWVRPASYIMGFDENSNNNFFNEFYYNEADWSLSTPFCSDLEIFSQLSPSIEYVNITSDTIYRLEDSFLEFSYVFSDDIGLNQFRVTIIDDFKDARLSSAPWNYSADYELSGTYTSGNIQIAIPFPDVEIGRYNLEITVQDTKGQESSISKTFYIKDQ